MEVPQVKKVSVVGDIAGFSGGPARPQVEFLRTSGRKLLRWSVWRANTVLPLLTRSMRAQVVARLLLAADATLRDLVEERLVADAELLGRAASIPMHLTEGIFDDRPFGFERGRLRDVSES